MIRRNFHTMQYSPDKESASEFCERFENCIRDYGNISDTATFSEEEKRDTFYNAIMTTVPSVQAVEFIRAEANRNQTKSGETRAAMTVKKGTSARCYECSDFGHISYDCPRKGTGVVKCYECNKFTNHKADECPQRQERLKKQGSTSGRVYKRGNGRYNYNKNLQKSGQINDRRQTLKRRNDDNTRGYNYKERQIQSK
ncbi:branchpoint-bridging protein-like [Chelonus insularis]|uniref:branchpoint-bridging protein-like n=1 Tax=Chelonus insularis TaxID=460826 RepID=UPI00158BDE46|nr:branchpoint-bridging protein-like [Chelonus insularis]